MKRFQMPYGTVLMTASDQEQYLAIPNTPINAAIISRPVLVVATLIVLIIGIALGFAYGRLTAAVERQPVITDRVVLSTSPTLTTPMRGRPNP